MAAFGGEVDRRRRALFAAANVAQIDRTTEPAAGLADQQDRLAFALEGERHGLGELLEEPTPPIVGVGRMARPLVSLQSETLPETTGKSSTRQASPMPRDAADERPMVSGRSGLPKLRLSVTASGRAPTAVRLRQASATACLPPMNEFGLAVARRHIDVSASASALVDAHDGGIAARPLHGVAENDVVVLSHTQRSSTGRRTDQLFQRIRHCSSAA